jgi:hypothetical protein
MAVHYEKESEVVSVELVRIFMRVFSFLFHGLLGMFMLGLSCLALMGGNHNLKLGVLPWTGATLTWALLGLGVSALAVILLAFKGTARIVFFLWTVAVFAALVRGFFLGPYIFWGAGSLWTAIYLTLGAFLAAVGGWFVFRGRPADRGRFQFKNRAMSETRS